MFDYSNLTKKDLVSDVESTFKKSSTLILEIKNSEIPEIMMFDSFERIIEDLSGRVAFLADVSDSEEIRNYGNEVESLIGNYLIEIFTDVDLFNKFNLIDPTQLDLESKKYHEELERDFIDAGHNLEENKKMRLIEIEKKLIDLEINFSKNIADDKSEVYFEPSELAGLSG